MWIWDFLRSFCFNISKSSTKLDFIANILISNSLKIDFTCLLKGKMGSVLLIENKYGLSKTFFRISLYLRIHWKLSTILKASKKRVWSNAFWYIKVYIFLKFMQYIEKINWEKHTSVKKKLYRTKLMLQKMHSFFFRELQLIIVLLLIRNSYTSWSTCFISLKPYVGFFIFDSVSFLLNFIFLSNKKHRLLTLKRHNSFENKNKRKFTHSFDPRTLVLKLQRKIDVETKFLNF